MRYNRFHQAYADLLFRIMGSADSIIEHNRRTGMDIRMLPEGFSFSISLQDGILPTCGYRKTQPRIAAAELAWCLSGRTSIKWLQKHTKVWDAFAVKTICTLCENGIAADGNPCYSCDDDGFTIEIKEAYGHRWRHAFKRDQLDDAIEALGVDPSNRRIWISSWDPAEDTPIGTQKTVPCPVGFTFSIAGGKLNSTLMIRSSDVFMGLPIDVMRHAMLMAAVASTLTVSLGYMQVCLAHPHIYESHFGHCEHILDGVALTWPKQILPLWTIDEIVHDGDAYVKEVETAAKEHAWPDFNPKLSVVQ